MDHLTIHKAHTAFKNKQFTTRELVKHYLNRINLYDKQGPSLNAILAIDPERALDEADRLDKHLEHHGSFVGPLHGIPVLVKDQAETEGIVTTYGSKLFKRHVPKKDATVVKRLKDAGAVVIAKTTLPGTPTLILHFLLSLPHCSIN